MARSAHGWLGLVVMRVSLISGQFKSPLQADQEAAPKNDPFADLPLLRNEQVIEAPTDRNLLTKRETEEAIQFIREHRDQPFFLYLPHNMPGSTRGSFASRVTFSPSQPRSRFGLVLAQISKQN